MKMTGIVTKIIREKQFGFIKSSQNGKDYFFHKDDCLNDLWEQLILNFFGESGGTSNVEFDDDRTDKGLRARNVRKLE